MLCDFHNGACSKAYHEACLGFRVPSSTETWMCPRHACAACGDWADITCRFCPNAACAKVTACDVCLWLLYVWASPSAQA